jgi:GTPase SAR1 family protein
MVEGSFASSNNRLSATRDDQYLQKLFKPIKMVVIGDGAVGKTSLIKR